MWVRSRGVRCACVRMCNSRSCSPSELSKILEFGETAHAMECLNHGITIIESDIYVNTSRIYSLGFPEQGDTLYPVPACGHW